jgi:hypothetical protein
LVARKERRAMRRKGHDYFVSSITTNTFTRLLHQFLDFWRFVLNA